MLPREKSFRPLSGSYISQLKVVDARLKRVQGFRPLSGSYISQFPADVPEPEKQNVSVPYRGATFLNSGRSYWLLLLQSFRPLSGSYISQ